MAINAAMYREMNEPKHVCYVQFVRNPPKSKLEDERKKAYIEDIITTTKNSE